MLLLYAFFDWIIGHLLMYGPGTSYRQATNEFLYESEFILLHQHVKSISGRPKNSDYGILNERAAAPVTHRCTVGSQQFLDPDRWTAKMATRRPIDCVCLAIDWPRSEGAHHSLSCSNVSSSPIHLHLSTALLGLISSTAPLVYIVVNPFITLHVS